MMRSKRKGQPFIDDLLPNETILWTGQPDPAILFTPQDLYLVPFSLMWGGFAIFWEASVLSGSAPFFFRLWGIPFVCVGLYFIFGRFIYKTWKKRHTFYAVTNKRILILRELWGSNLHAFFIDSLPTLNKRIGRNGAGTITFGIPPKKNWWSRSGTVDYSNTGMELFGGGAELPGFYDIRDANDVYRGLTELMDASPVKNPMGKAV
jgi:hypothetical protein